MPSMVSSMPSVFQSLFFWKRRENPTIPTKTKIPITGFNPCFSGRGVKTISVLLDLVMGLSFQSLFFWKRRENPNGLPLGLSSIVVSILVFLEEAWKQSRGNGSSGLLWVFQSLFFWKRRENFCHGDSRNCDGIVSILVFLEEAWKLIVRSSYGVTLGCFNPCFSGRGVKTSSGVCSGT